jgi:hypothetical protein
MRGQAEAGQAGGGENDGVVLPLVELAQARVEVAAQAGDGEVGIACMQLRLAAQAGGAHHAAGRNVLEGSVLVRDNGIERILARRDGHQRELRLHRHRHILHGMHGDVGASIEQGRFQLLDEEPLAADLGQRPVEDLVAARRHAEQLDGAAWI